MELAESSLIHVEPVTAIHSSQVVDRHFQVMIDSACNKETATKIEWRTNREMNISQNGVEMIARYEGCRLQAYKCPAGVWTIGYGHTAGVKSGDKLSSEAEAKNLLKEDLKKYGEYVNACKQKGQIKFSMTQNMFDALTSFCYNCGNGNLQKLVEGRDVQTVADKMLLYSKAGGKELEGLKKRRKEERELFLKQ